MAAGEYEIRSLSSDVSYSFDFDSMSEVSGGGYSSTTAVCQTCSQTPCICSQYVAVVAGQWNTVTVAPNIGTLPASDVEEIVESLKVCIVCGAEDCLVLCSVCVEAVKLARNRWLDDFRREIESLDSN